MPDKTLSQNILTALGALCLDDDFRSQYFQSPALALINHHHIPMSDGEFVDFVSMVPTSPSPSQKDFAALGGAVCPKRPCLYSRLGIQTVLGAAIMDHDFRAILFENSDPAFNLLKFLASYDLYLDADELILLRRLLKRDITAAMAKLEAGIRHNLPSVVWVLAKVPVGKPQAA